MCDKNEPQPVSPPPSRQERVSPRAEDEQIAALQAEIASLREVAELREQFIAVLAHDLRNPLSGAMACSQALQLHRPDDVLAQKLATKMLRNTRRMTELINEVADFARGKLRGGIGVHISSCTDLADALGAVVDEIREANPRQLIELSVNCEGPVYCDRGRVQQLLSNLLGNAVVHCEPGRPITVRAVLEQSDFVLSVHNYGQVISAEHLTQVFAPYWQAVGSGNRRHGLGLGLHICKQIASGHGGAISVTSSKSEGTLFETRMPRQAIASPDS